MNNPEILVYSFPFSIKNGNRFFFSGSHKRLHITFVLCLLCSPPIILVFFSVDSDISKIGAIGDNNFIFRAYKTKHCICVCIDHIELYAHCSHLLFCPFSILHSNYIISLFSFGLFSSKIILPEKQNRKCGFRVSKHEGQALPSDHYYTTGRDLCQRV